MNTNDPEARRLIRLGVQLAAWQLSRLSKAPPEKYPDDLKRYARYIAWITASNAYYLYNDADFIAGGCLDEQPAGTRHDSVARHTENL